MGGTEKHANFMPACRWFKKIFLHCRDSLQENAPNSSPKGKYVTNMGLVMYSDGRVTFGVVWGEGDILMVRRT